MIEFHNHVFQSITPYSSASSLTAGTTLFFFGSISYRHRKIAGKWKQMIVARRICEAAQIKLGALMVGKNEIVYLEFYREISF